MPRLDFDPASASSTTPSTVWIAEQARDSWRALAPEVDAARCTGCAICWKYCPDASVAMEAGKAVIDLAHCKGCGVCATECPAHCIAMKAEPEP